MDEKYIENRTDMIMLLTKNIYFFIIISSITSIGESRQNSIFYISKLLEYIFSIIIINIRRLLKIKKNKK